MVVKRDSPDPRNRKAVSATPLLPAPALPTLTPLPAVNCAPSCSYDTVAQRDVAIKLIDLEDM